MENKIKVLMVEPNKEPYETKIGTDLKSCQQAVGGLIECIYLDDNAIMVCNEEAKLIGLEGNRSLGKDIIAGTFFICGDKDGEFVSLTNDQINEYSNRFHEPEYFTKEDIEDTIGFTFISL